MGDPQLTKAFIRNAPSKLICALMHQYHQHVLQQPSEPEIVDEMVYKGHRYQWAPDSQFSYIINLRIWPDAEARENAERHLNRLIEERDKLELTTRIAVDPADAEKDDKLAVIRKAERDLKAMNKQVNALIAQIDETHSDRVISLDLRELGPGDEWTLIFGTVERLAINAVPSEKKDADKRVDGRQGDAAAGTNP